MKSIRFLYPEGRVKALTMSYDDGVFDDIRLIEIFNRYQIKATFHLNAGVMGQGKRIPESEICKVYDGHEISCHSYFHPFMERIPRAAMLNEIFDCRKKLEALSGQMVRGMSYPMGTFNGEVKNVLRNTGIV